MVASVVTGKTMQPGAVDGLDESGCLAGVGNNRLFDQHVPAACRCRNAVCGVKRCRGGDDHALCLDID